jgi:hypothetical protein
MERILASERGYPCATGLGPLPFSRRELPVIAPVPPMSSSERLVPPIGAVFASRLVGDEGRKVCFLYREVPDHEADSGWRIFSGEEDQDFADDPDNIKIYDADTIARIDPDIVPLLAEPAPCAFERASPDEPFVRVEDFEFEGEEGS